MASTTAVADETADCLGPALRLPTPAVSTTPADPGTTGIAETFMRASWKERC
jgi:hypothetical protein